MPIKHSSLLLAGCAAILVTACGGSPQNSAELEQRAADLELRESELAAREAALVEQPAPVVEATAPAPAPTPVVAQKPAAKPAPKPVAKPAKPAASTPVVTAPAPAPAPRVVTVPSGTQLSLALSSDLSSKTALPGDAIRARLTNDVIVDGRVALGQGTIVSGKITDVVSGSRKIGGVPMLAMSFDQIELAGGGSLPIRGEIIEKGNSDTARDTAKIAGGAAAGAIIGNQLGHGDGNKVIGGILGGAIGAVAARRTGTEVQLAAGTPVSIALSSSLDVTLR